MSTVDNALQTLFRAAAPNLSPRDLVTISDLTEEARSAALRLGVVCEGIAELVISDAEKACSTGVFTEPVSIVGLLLAVGQSLDVIAGMIRIGSDANDAFERANAADSMVAQAAQGGAV